MSTSTRSTLPIIAGLDTLRVLRRFSHWLSSDMREYDEEWAAAIDILGYCRLAIYDVVPTDRATLDLQEIALATHIVQAYHRTGFATQICAGNVDGTEDGDALYYLPALKQTVRTMCRHSQ